jgi:ketopantoate reductase
MRTDDPTGDLEGVRVSAGLPKPLSEAEVTSLIVAAVARNLGVAQGQPAAEAGATAVIQPGGSVRDAEVIAAARALGLQLGDELIDFNVDRTRPMGPYRPSTMIDFMEGRELELGPIWEEPLRRANAAGVVTPALERLLSRMKARLAERG